MNKKLVLIPLLSFLVLMISVQTAKAATITSATTDKTTYLGGQTGYISVSVYNDENAKIRVTELSVTMNYYYTDSTIYVQKFFYPSETLPDEIQVGQSKTYQIPISLPTNIASGYTKPIVEAKTDLWRPQDSRWFTSDRPTYELKLYIESPYRQLYETSQGELQDQKASNVNLSSTMNMLAVATIVFAATAGFLMFIVFTRRTKPIPQP